MECIKCNSGNLELIEKKKQAGKLFLLGAVLFPLFFIFWPMAILTLFAKSVYHCQDCGKSFVKKD